MRCRASGIGIGIKSVERDNALRFLYRSMGTHGYVADALQIRLVLDFLRQMSFVSDAHCRSVI